MLLPVLALVLFVGLLLVAACTDIASLTIPNWIPATLAALYIVMALAAGTPLLTIGMHLLFGFGVLVVGFFLFQAGIFGGGDAKLLGAAAVWTGATAFLPFAFWTVLAGGVLAFALLVARKWAPMIAGAPDFVNRLLMPKGGVPYGVAIMVGGVMAASALPILGGALTLL